MSVDLELLNQTVREASEIILQARITPDQIRSKTGHQNFVTKYDLEVQEFLARRFMELWPEYHFMAEEQELYEFREKSFIVDPIDGTSNFIFGIPQFCTSVAVVEGGKVVQGVVFNPVANDLYLAEMGQGSYLNGVRIENPDLPLEHTLFGIGTSPYDVLSRGRTLELIDKVMAQSIDIRRLGSSALDLCYVADGRQGGYFELDINPWDIAAGMLIAREAGAIVSTMCGEEPPLDRTLTILAAGPSTYAEMKKIIGF